MQLTQAASDRIIDLIRTHGREGLVIDAILAEIVDAADSGETQYELASIYTRAGAPIVIAIDPSDLVADGVLTSADIEAATKIACDSRYGYHGLRVVDAADPARVGDEIAPSRRWDDGDELDEILAGTSAISIGLVMDEDETENVARAARTATLFRGTRVLLLGSDAASYGEDVGEIVMRDAVVLAEFRRR